MLCCNCRIELSVCLNLRQIDIKFIKIDFLMHNQYVFSFQNYLKGKKFS